MKIGSLVICVNPFEGNEGIKQTVKGKIYTVRNIMPVVDHSGVGLLLEEIVNGLYFDGEEYGYKIDRFRELDTPISINIEEIIALEV